MTDGVGRTDHDGEAWGDHAKWLGFTSPLRPGLTAPSR